MRVFRNLDEARAGFAPSFVTIGNFDGVHAGHRALLRRTVERGREAGVKPSAVTFHPHPTAVVAPERTPKLLTTIEERCALMGAEGIEQIMVLAFDKALASMGPDEFFRTVLTEALGARGVVIGDNFRFGHDQAGGVGTLRELGAGAGVRVDVVEPVWRRGRLVSSSEVRRLLREGRVGMAGRLLERAYALSGVVVRGSGRGARETVPTLNLEVASLDHAERAVPREGVYITRTLDSSTGRAWRSITNAGFRPTFGGAHLTIETFLLQPLEGPTPRQIRVEFLRWLRGERRFESAESLRRQILLDAGRAECWHRRYARWTGAEVGLAP